MEKFEKSEVLSRAVRAGKRTYFFDVKTTKSDEKYLTMTESKRRFNPDTGLFTYEKHKLFLYKEDFEKFHKALGAIINFIETGQLPDDSLFASENPKFENQESADINFEDLDL